MAANENPIESRTVLEPQHDGDVIEVGDISDSTAVAIGRGARVTLEQYTEIIIKADSFEDLPPAPGEAPYKGLAYFTEADKDIYFGRETLSEQIVERLRDTSFLALIGASGSGKSSLLRAGLIPRLRARNWRIHLVSKPGANPLTMLANNLMQEELDPASAVAIANALAADPGTLVTVCEKLAARHGAERLLLAIDQFEELFTQCKDAAERLAVVDNLVGAANAAGETAVLISMRADFYDRVSEFAILTDLVSQQQEYVKPMSQSDLVRVIAEPARLGGWQFVEGLVNQIVEDVGREPGRLPLLSHALLETWERRRGVVLTLGGYRDTGGVEGAIAQTAEETLHKLVKKNPAYEDVCREIFLALTELGEGAEDTRRVADREELRTAFGDGELDAVLEALVAARLVTVRSSEVEVAHEALIRRWPALKEWLADNRERLRFERQLARDAALWGKSGCDEDMLYRGARLAQAAELTAQGQIGLAGQTAEFVAAGRELEEREEREREEQRQRELEGAQRLASAAQAREAAEIKARSAAEAQRATEENARLQAEADAGNLRRRAFYLMGALAVAAILAIVAFIFFQNAQSSAQEAQDNLARATVALIAEATAVREAEENLVSANNSAATATRNLATAEAAKATSVYNEHQAGFQAATAEAERAVAKLQGERALAQSLQANSRALAANGSNSQELAQARLLAVDGAEVSERVGSPAEKTSSASLLFSLAYEQPIPFQAQTTLIEHTKSIRSIARSGDGSRLASASYDDTVIIWDTASWEAETTLIGHGDGVWSVAWNQDGSRLASTSCGERDEDFFCIRGEVIIWDTVSWQPLMTLTDHKGAVNSVAWNQDGSRLASTSCGEHDEDFSCIRGEVIIWDTASWQPVTTLREHREDVNSVTWNGNGSRLASASDDDTVIIWDTASWQPVTTLSDHTSWVMSVAWNGDGSRLASASWDATIIIWDTASWEAETTLIGHGDGVNSVAWNEDGNRLASASLDNTVIIWDTENWEALESLTGHAGPVWSVVWNEDGNRLASASYDYTVIIWDTESWEPQTTLTDHTDAVRNVAWNGDGSRLASASDDTTVIIWDTASWERVTTLTDHTDAVMSVAWNHDDSRLASASDDTTVIIWDTASWEPVTTLSDHTSGVRSVAWNHDGSRLATASAFPENQIIIWDTESWQPLTTLTAHSSWVMSVAWNGDGSRLASASWDNTVIIWDTESWQRQATLKEHTRWINSVAWSGDSSRLSSASVSPENKIIIWDTASWQPLMTLTDHKGAVNSVAWNRETSRLASASDNTTVIIWDTASWLPLTTLTDHKGAVNSVAWNGEGSLLASASDDGTVIIWEFPDFERLNCQMAGRNLSLVEWEQFLPGMDYRCTCTEWPAGEGAPPDAPGCVN